MSAELAARRTAAAAVLADYQRAAAGADVADRALWGARLADMLGLVLAGLGAQHGAAAKAAAEAGGLRELAAEILAAYAAATACDRTPGTRGNSRSGVTAPGWIGHEGRRACPRRPGGASAAYRHGLALRVPAGRPRAGTHPGRRAGRRRCALLADRPQGPVVAVQVREEDRMTTMASLTPGTRVRHAEWNETGTIRVLGGVTKIRWDEVFGEIEVSPEGPVFPSDLEIIGGTAQ